MYAFGWGPLSKYSASKYFKSQITFGVVLNKDDERPLFWTQFMHEASWEPVKHQNGLTHDNVPRHQAETVPLQRNHTISKQVSFILLDSETFYLLLSQ